jgi:hypothetical protein
MGCFNFLNSIQLLCAVFRWRQQRQVMRMERVHLRLSCHVILVGKSTWPFQKHWFLIFLVTPAIEQTTIYPFHSFTHASPCNNPCIIHSRNPIPPHTSNHANRILPEEIENLSTHTEIRLERLHAVQLHQFS